MVEKVYIFIPSYWALTLALNYFNSNRAGSLKQHDKKLGELVLQHGEEKARFDKNEKKRTRQDERCLTTGIYWKQTFTHKITSKLCMRSEQYLNKHWNG